MSGRDVGLVVIYLVVLLASAWPLGIYMVRVYANRPLPLDPVLGPLERGLYRLAGTRREAEMDGRQYAGAFLASNMLGGLAVYALQRTQAWLPLNPDRLPSVPPDLAFNTAVSFATNTNWQNYAGETTLSPLTQMAGLTVQNFLSAAAGMAVLAALARGIGRRESRTLGNYWVDLVRSVLHVLLPLSLLLAMALVSQGVVQTLAGGLRADLVDPLPLADGAVLSEQMIARGPVASQVAIKQLGTNGGGFFGANSSHPLENPTPVSNLLECLTILLIPAALCVTFGRMVGRPRDGVALLLAMLAIFLPLLALSLGAESAGNERLAPLAVDSTSGPDRAGGNMEGKEIRFGPAASALWAVATTAASNGSVNSMHDSAMPGTAFATLLLMQLGEVVFGGVGVGLCGMVVFALIAVFIGGLMVGRTPEYLGKKVEAFEMKMAALAVLLPAAVALVGAAVSVALPGARAAASNPAPHGFCEILYAWSSAANNNGSAFAGLVGNTPFYNVGLALAMFAGRYAVTLPVLALAASLARKRRLEPGPGTLPTDGTLFIGLLVGVVLIVGALTFLPALALGPIAEQLQLLGP